MERGVRPVYSAPQMARYDRNLGRLTNRIREGGFRGVDPSGLMFAIGPTYRHELPGRESSMRCTRWRSVRSESTRRRHVTQPESLESRVVLSSALPTYLAPWIPSDLPVENPVTHQREFISQASLRPANPNSPLYSNEGKIVSGTDRAGDLWTITVHGPGKVIVTDTTPNDGVLDDDINTIQLVGTSPTKTYVTGLVRASATNLTTGTIPFNELIATSGVRSIELNGFNLTDQVSPGVTSPTGIFLPGGVRVLSFNGIIAQLDTSITTTPYQIIIGSGTQPLKVAPSIYVNSIQDLVFNSTATTIPTTPITSPTVQFIINGNLQNFDITSATQGPITAGFQFEFPVVGTTGRTAVQALGVNNLNVHGSAVNFTVSKSPKPFSSEASGVNYLHKATFGGVADAVGLDVNGPINRLTFKRGLGNPSGVSTAITSSGQTLPATAYGTTEGSTGYPAAGDLGGVVKATHIHKLDVGPANEFTQTAQNPEFVQSREQGFPYYQATPGYALSNAVISTEGSIDKAKIKGSLQNSEVKTGFDYTAYVAGLQGTRGASRIGRLRVNGSLVNSAISASFIPAKNHYTRQTGIAGNGTIRGRVTGSALDAGGTTGLGNTGAGVFAKHLKGRLPATQ